MLVSIKLVKLKKVQMSRILELKLSGTEGVLQNLELKCKELLVHERINS